MMYVLDTNTLIYFFKNQGKVAENLLNCAPKDIAIPAVVLYELQVGIAKSNNPIKRKKQLSELTNIVRILPFASNEAEITATIRACLERAGNPIGPYDLLIAGTCMANAATLVTHNTQEFSRIPNLPLADWY